MQDDNIGNQAEPAEKPLPSTLEGLKKLAKRIKREDGHKHHEALEIAARRMGFTCYTHARKELNDDGRP